MASPEGKLVTFVNVEIARPLSQIRAAFDALIFPSKTLSTRFPNLKYTSREKISDGSADNIYMFKATTRPLDIVPSWLIGELKTLETWVHHDSKRCTCKLANENFTSIALVVNTIDFEEIEGATKMKHNIRVSFALNLEKYIPESLQEMLIEEFRKETQFLTSAIDELCCDMEETKVTHTDPLEQKSE